MNALSWQLEVWTMRFGRNADLRSWSMAARSQWAGDMLELSFKTDGTAEQLHDEREWLYELIRRSFSARVGLEEARRVLNATPGRMKRRAIR